MKTISHKRKFKALFTATVLFASVILMKRASSEVIDALLMSAGGLTESPGGMLCRFGAVSLAAITVSVIFRRSEANAESVNGIFAGVLSADMLILLCFSLSSDEMISSLPDSRYFLLSIFILAIALPIACELLFRCQQKILLPLPYVGSVLAALTAACVFSEFAEAAFLTCLVSGYAAQRGMALAKTLFVRIMTALTALLVVFCRAYCFRGLSAFVILISLVVIVSGVLPLFLLVTTPNTEKERLSK